MGNRFRSLVAPWALAASLIAALLVMAPGLGRAAEDPFAAIVGVHAKVPRDARSAGNLGRERSGSGIVIDSSGLVVTIGYLIVEGSELSLDFGGKKIPATLVTYDHESGFGLLRAVVPLDVKPMALGNSGALKIGDPFIAAAVGGMAAALPVRLAAKQPYAASWEYMLDEALFTSPPHPSFGGAALMDKDAKLVGIGSLILQHLPGARADAGNLWVPVDRLKPLLADLVALGHSAAPPHPWLGINASDQDGRVVVVTVSPDGPAEAAGLHKGDAITAIGDRPVRDLADFYRKLWSTGPAGSDINLTLRQGSNTRRVIVHSVDRLSFLKLKPTL